MQYQLVAVLVLTGYTLTALGALVGIAMTAYWLGCEAVNQIRRFRQ